MKIMKRLSLLFLFIVMVIGVAGCGKANQKTDFSLWNDNSQAVAELRDYVEAVTKTGGEDFIPQEDRIAVFDLDGTLFCETDPIYFDWYMFAHRVKDDADFTATEEQIAVADKILAAARTGEIPDELEEEHALLNPQLYKGMTLEEFKNYVRDFMAQPAEGYDGMNRGEAFYQPMLQVVSYLQDNGFTVYICSGTDRITVRTQIEGVINIPERQVIGTDNTIVASGQGDTDGLNYVYDDTDKLVLGGKFIVKNVKMNKVSVIAQEIGTQPVLSFGNSSGDASMAEYVVNDNKYKSAAFMLLCDDTERENGNTEKAAKMEELCTENGWIPISMKNDWTTIYGEGVTRK